MIAERSLKPVVAELRGNARLRWGVWAIVGIVWFYGILVLRDAVPRQDEIYRDLGRKLARTQAVATHSEWTARRDQARATELRFENALWSATSMGLAEASFHDWLAGLAHDAHVSGLQLTVASQSQTGGPSDASPGEATTAAMPAAWKVSAKMSFDFSPPSFYPLLGRIAGADRRVLVESLVIHSTPRPRAELQLVAYFRSAAASSDGARTAAVVNR